MSLELLTLHGERNLHTRMDGQQCSRRELLTSSSLSEPPTYDTAGNTEWYWSGNDTKELTYIISHKNKGARKKRGGKPNEFYRTITFRVYRCLYEGCLPPPPPTVPAGRPMDFLSWSSEDDWASLGLTKPAAGANGLLELVLRG